MSLPALPFLFASDGSGEGKGRNRLEISPASSSDHPVPAAAAESIAADQLLVDAIRNPDERLALAAFETLYRRHADLLIAFAAAVAGDRGDATDVVHDVFVSLWEHRLTWRPDPTRGLRNYLYVSVRNTARNHARTERRAEVRAFRVTAAEPSIVPAQSEPDDDAETLARVWEALDQLPSLRKQVAMLRWGEGMTPQDIADTLGINRNAVDQHLYRAIQTLRTIVPNRIV